MGREYRPSADAGPPGLSSRTREQEAIPINDTITEKRQASTVTNGQAPARSKTRHVPDGDRRAGSGVALLTGCSTGIGRATATTLVAAGYRVVATARNPETLEGIGAEMALRLDVVDEASIVAAVGAVLQLYGRIDILINNAGYSMRGAVEELDVDAVARMFDVNVLGIIRMARAVAPVMRQQGSGRIVNVGSLAGKLGGPSNGSYAAMKHAVEALSDAMRWELAPFGIFQLVLWVPVLFKGQYPTWGY
jgi:NADP-dependent 3-hydroxy acid dehydrogenase YdfG